LIKVIFLNNYLLTPITLFIYRYKKRPYKNNKILADIKDAKQQYYINKYPTIKVQEKPQVTEIEWNFSFWFVLMMLHFVGKNLNIIENKEAQLVACKVSSEVNVEKAKYTDISSQKS
jgi:hypothetical protein